MKKNKRKTKKIRKAAPQKKAQPVDMTTSTDTKAEIKVTGIPATLPDSTSTASSPTFSDEVKTAQADVSEKDLPETQPEPATEGKPESKPPVLVDVPEKLIGVLVNFPFEWMAQRNPKWKLTDRESKDLTGATQDVVNKHLPGLLEKYGAETMLAVTAGMIVGSRLLETKKKPAVEVKNVEPNISTES